MSSAWCWPGARSGSPSARPRRTYGLRRSSILAALANAVLLLVAIGAIAWEAVQRFAEPGAGGRGDDHRRGAYRHRDQRRDRAVLHVGPQGDLNIRGAFLHMAADAGVSLGVVVAGIASW